MNDARAAFREAYGDNPNFMTPDVIEYGTTGRYAVELSTGRGLVPGTTIWGVTVLKRTADGWEKTGPKSCGGLGDSFSTESEARTYIANLPR